MTPKDNHRDFLQFSSNKFMEQTIRLVNYQFIQSSVTNFVVGIQGDDSVSSPPCSNHHFSPTRAPEQATRKALQSDSWLQAVQQSLNIWVMYDMTWKIWKVFRSHALNDPGCWQPMIPWSHPKYPQSTTKKNLDVFWSSHYKGRPWPESMHVPGFWPPLREWIMDRFWCYFSPCCLWWWIPSSLHSFAHSFIGSFIGPFVGSLVHTHIHTQINVYVYI